VAIHYRHFDTNSRSKHQNTKILDFEEGPTDCSEFSLMNYHILLRNIPKSAVLTRYILSFDIGLCCLKFVWLDFAWLFV